jgi:4-amino-4-deoxy-L-arabinose transferase-like glycosyltransferase
MVQNGTFMSFLHDLDWDNLPLDLIPFLRAPIILGTTISIIGVYYLLCKLFDHRIALIGGLLLTLDPWLLGHSRALHHDALMTTFMTLSALALLLHINGEGIRWPLLLSGIFAGLALLSKSLSIFLMPWTVLLFIVALWRKQWPITQVMIDAAAWTLTTWLTFFLLWPAMWMSRTQTLWRIFQTAVTYAINPHEKGQFFLGQPINDPGPFFYLVVFLFALTPLVIVGLIALAWARVRLSQAVSSQRWETITLLLIYCAAYIVFISLGEKKQVRYLLPMITMLNVIAAAGLIWLADHSATKLVPNISLNNGLLPISGAILFPIVLMTQLLTTLPSSPYYLSYYNPLLGGNKVASQLFLIGWGEGTDLAAHYLNGLPNAEELTVVTSTPTTFAPFFHGKTLLWRPGSQMLIGDYLVLYLRDVQREQPDPAILRYIQQEFPLETTVELNGLTYAWIYRAPAADWSYRTLDSRTSYRLAGLMGYSIENKDVASGQELELTLYRRHWPAKDDDWLIQLKQAEHFWIAQSKEEEDDRDKFQPGEIMEDKFFWSISQEMKPGRYEIMIGLQNNERIDWLAPSIIPPINVNVQP